MLFVAWPNSRATRTSFDALSFTCSLRCAVFKERFGVATNYVWSEFSERQMPLTKVSQN